ncbi:chorismate mutase [Pelagibacterales bacterium SAG-MED05]|nr:chorismate mutase [Pelagibacterales bacterium SAG-MED05]
MKNKKIDLIRKKLDKLDLKMLTLIKKRSILVNKILKEKKYKNQIIDNKRIKIILRKISKESKKINLDTKITNSIWKAMIKSFINYEFRNFKKK